MRGALTEKVQIMIDEGLVARIDDWRFANRSNSRSQAMRDLIVRALDEASKGSERSNAA